MAELELPENATFRRREWRFQRFGWGLITLAFAGAALGGWGYGPFSQAVEASGDAAAEYTRIVHRDTPDELILRGDGTSVRLLGDWIDSVEIQQIIPEPDSMTADAQGLTLEFGGNQVHASLTYKASHFGPLTGVVEVGDDKFEIWQTVLP